MYVITGNFNIYDNLHFIHCAKPAFLLPLFTEFLHQQTLFSTSEIALKCDFCVLYVIIWIRTLGLRPCVCFWLLLLCVMDQLTITVTCMTDGSAWTTTSSASLQTPSAVCLRTCKQTAVPQSHGWEGGKCLICFSFLSLSLFPSPSPLYPSHFH